MSQVYYNPKFGYYTQGTIQPYSWGRPAVDYGATTNRSVWDAYVSNGYIKPVTSPTGSSASSLYNPKSINVDYTPNQFTKQQLASYRNTAPRWMQQAFANKMAGYGAPANGTIPYKMTSSSFRGMPVSGNQAPPISLLPISAAGKAAPVGGTQNG